jgi:hypothetical protein
MDFVSLAFALSPLLPLRDPSPSASFLSTMPLSLQHGFALVGSFSVQR